MACNVTAIIFKFGRAFVYLIRLSLALQLKDFVELALRTLQRLKRHIERQG